MTKKSEKLEAKKVELAELTKIAKVILIDGFSDHVDGSTVPSCYGLNDMGTWGWIYNPGTARYTGAVIKIKPSSALEPTTHINIGYVYEIVDNTGSTINIVPPEGHQHYNYYLNNANRGSSVIRRRHIILLDKFLAKKNHSTRGLLGSTSILLKISRRPTEEEFAWAASVLSNEGIQSDAGGHTIELTFSATVTQIFSFNKVNGVQDAITRAENQLSNQSSTIYIPAKITNIGPHAVTNSTFVEERVYLHSVDRAEFMSAKEI
jgi:hypothetical protein